MRSSSSPLRRHFLIAPWPYTQSRMAANDDNAAADGHYGSAMYLSRCRYSPRRGPRGLLSNNNVDVMGIVIIIYAVLSDEFTKRGATTRSYILRYTHYRVIVVHIMYTIYIAQRYCTAARVLCAWSFCCHPVWTPLKRRQHFLLREGWSVWHELLFQKPYKRFWNNFLCIIVYYRFITIFLFIHLFFFLNILLLWINKYISYFILFSRIFRSIQIKFRTLCL